MFAEGYVWRGLRAATRFRQRESAHVCVLRVCARAQPERCGPTQNLRWSERYAGLGRPNAPRQVDT